MRHSSYNPIPRRDRFTRRDADSIANEVTEEALEAVSIRMPNWVQDEDKHRAFAMVIHAVIAKLKAEIGVGGIEQYYRY